MLYLLTSHTTGRLAFPLKHFLRAALPDGRYRLVNAVPTDLAPTDVIVGFTNPASNGLRKLKLSKDEIREASKFNLRHKLGAPGPVDELRGTFWRSRKLPGHPFCCVTWHVKAGLYVYRTLTARWLKIASLMASKATAEEQDAMLHKWRAEIEPPLEERLFRHKVVAVDSENDWNGERATKLTMFSIADEDGSAVWVWTPEVAKVFAKWMQDSSVTKILQNWVHDIPWFEHSTGVQFVGPLQDTMSLRAEFCRQWPLSLQDIAAQFLIVEPWKLLHREGALAEIDYAAYDAEATFLVANELWRLMPSLKNIEIPLVGGWSKWANIK